MLIYSQNKEALVNLDQTESIRLREVTDGKVLVVYGRDAFVIGTYSSKAKAIKVLGMIRLMYKNSCHTIEVYDQYNKPIPYVIMNNFVFDMPQDEEVREG